MSLSRDGLFLAVGCNSGDAFVVDVPGRRLAGAPLRHPDATECDRVPPR